jgi:hypothetical protein
MALNFKAVPLRFLVSLILMLLLAIPEAVFAAPVELQAPAQLNLIIVEGDGAINNVRQRTAREPIVQVQDENRKPVAGATVLFLLPQGGPGGTFANGTRMLKVMTDGKGRAIAKGLRLNEVSGKFQIQVEASYQGATATTTISQSNAVLTAAAAAGTAPGQLASIIMAVGAIATAVIVVSVQDKGPAYRANNRDK